MLDGLVKKSPVSNQFSAQSLSKVEVHLEDLETHLGTLLPNFPSNEDYQQVIYSKSSRDG